MGEVNRRRKAVIQSIDVGDRNTREFFFRDTFEAPKVDAIHDTDGRFGADTVGAHTTDLAEVVLVFLRVEQVLRQLRFTRQQAEAFCLSHRWPETSSSAIEQLHLYEFCVRSRSASNLTAPQWQLPRYVICIGGP